jgi:hypothetical protein
MLRELDKLGLIRKFKEEGTAHEDEVQITRLVLRSPGKTFYEVIGNRLKHIKEIRDSFADCVNRGKGVYKVKNMFDWDKLESVFSFHYGYDLLMMINNREAGPGSPMWKMALVVERLECMGIDLVREMIYQVGTYLGKWEMGMEGKEKRGVRLTLANMRESFLSEYKKEFNIFNTLILYVEMVLGGFQRMSGIFGGEDEINIPRLIERKGQADVIDYFWKGVYLVRVKRYDVPILTKDEDWGPIGKDIPDYPSYEVKYGEEDSSYSLDVGKLYRDVPENYSGEIKRLEDKEREKEREKEKERTSSRSVRVVQGRR